MLFTIAYHPIKINYVDGFNKSPYFIKPSAQAYSTIVKCSHTTLYERQ